jgi:hypothetical protein
VELRVALRRRKPTSPLVSLVKTERRTTLIEFPDATRLPRAGAVRHSHHSWGSSGARVGVHVPERERDGGRGGGGGGGGAAGRLVISLDVGGHS